MWNQKNALRIPISEVRERLKVCESKCDYFRRHGHRSRRKFLERHLSVARIKKKAKAEKQILEIIEREKQRAFWQRLNYAMRKKGGGSIRSVQIQTDEGKSPSTQPKTRWRRRSGVKSTGSGSTWPSKHLSVKAVFEVNLVIWQTPRQLKKYCKVATNQRRRHTKAPSICLRKSPVSVQ
jgi:hypothetical protein